MDYIVIAAERSIRDQEAANEEACRECAQASGYTPEQAEQCDDGDLRCRDCPFIRRT